MIEKQKMSENTNQPGTPDAPKTSPEAEKAKAQEAGKFKLSNLPGALSKAWESLHSKENKDKGFLMKVGIFFSAFFDEMKWVEKEKIDVRHFKIALYEFSQTKSITSVDMLWTHTGTI